MQHNIFAPIVFRFACRHRCINAPMSSRKSRRFLTNELPFAENPIGKSGWMKKASMLHSTLARSFIQILSANESFLIVNR